MTKATLTPVRKTAAPAPQADSQTNGSSAPIWKRQINRVQGAMWKHDQKGTARYTISISRSYKDEKGKWQSVHYFDSQDLDDVVAIAKEASNEVLDLQGLTLAVSED